MEESRSRRAIASDSCWPADAEVPVYSDNTGGSSAVMLAEPQATISENYSLRPLEFQLDRSVDDFSVIRSSNSQREIEIESTSARSNIASPLVDEPNRRYQILLLISGFMMIFNILGINFSYGIFQEYYSSDQTHIKGTQSQDALISLIGSIGSGLTWSGGILVNPLMSKVDNPRWITLSGVFIMSLGLLLASFSSQLWHLYLTQALLYGIGASMYYFPIISITPVYFDGHRGFAMGFILAGAGVGGLVYAPVLQILVDKLGAAWALRIISLWNLVTGLPIACVVRHRPGFGLRRNHKLNWELVKRGTFMYQTLGAFLQAAGNLVPMYYLTSYSISVLSYSSSFASVLLALNNAVNSVSRICMGHLADKVGRQNTMLIGTFLSALSVFALWYDAARTRFIVFIVMYGVYAGGYNALLPTTVAEIYGIQNYSSVNALLYFIRGLGSICGAPLAGLILGSYNRTSMIKGVETLEKRYNNVVIYDGILLMCATVCVACVRWFDAKEKGWRWKA